MATFDRNQIKDFIGVVEDHTAEFIGIELCGARLAGFISRMHEQGKVSDAEARQLIDDVYRQMRGNHLGHKYVRMVRNPSAELRILVLANEGRSQ
jgi:polyhydroxyalkanoate synthesis regulator phasin